MNYWFLPVGALCSHWCFMLLKINALIEVKLSSSCSLSLECFQCHISLVFCHRVTVVLSTSDGTIHGVNHKKLEDMDNVGGGTMVSQSAVWVGWF